MPSHPTMIQKKTSVTDSQVGKNTRIITLSLCSSLSCRFGGQHFLIRPLAGAHGHRLAQHD